MTGVQNIIVEKRARQVGKYIKTEKNKI
jgi:hypothetical protein